MHPRWPFSLTITTSEGGWEAWIVYGSVVAGGRVRAGPNLFLAVLCLTSVVGTGLLELLFWSPGHKFFLLTKSYITGWSACLCLPRACWAPSQDLVLV